MPFLFAALFDNTENVAIIEVNTHKKAAGTVLSGRNCTIREPLDKHQIIEYRPNEPFYFEVGYLGAVISAVCLVLMILMNIDKHINQIQAGLEAKHANEANHPI